MQDLQRACQASKLPPVGVPEVAGFAPLAGPAMQQAKSTLQQYASEIRPTAPQQMQQQFQAKGGLQSAGAAATTDQAAVNAMLAKASPELQNELKSTPVNQINMPALERHVEACQCIASRLGKCEEGR